MVRRFPLTLAVFLLWVLLYVAFLWVRPMAAPDEYRYAEIPREMLVSGDWVVPQLNGMPYFEKPVLGYWASAISMMIFGQNAFAARLPSALAIGLLAFLMGIFLRSFPDHRAGPLAAAMFLTSLLPLAIGTIAILDGLFSAFITLSLLGFFLAMQAGTQRDETPFLFLGGLGLGLAFLTKGFLAIVIPGLVLLPYLLLTRSLIRFLRRAWIPLLWALLVSAPWSVLVALRSNFWEHFFWVEHVQRFLDPGDNQHVEAFWFYLPRLVAGLIPWIALIPAAIVGLNGLENPHFRRLRAFALFWVLGPLLFFSISSGKLVTYILPCIPALIILLALGTLKYLQMGGRRLLGLAAGLNMILGSAVLLTLLWGRSHGGAIVTLFLEKPSAWIPLVAGSFLGILLGVMAMGRKSSGRRLALLVAAPAILFLGWQLALDARILRSPGELLRKVKHEMGSHQILVGNGNTVQALCWESRRTDVEVFANPRELEYGLANTPGRRLLDVEDLQELVSRDKEGVWLLVDNRRWDGISQYFPHHRNLGSDRHYSLVELSDPGN